jgi:hypothetical protein
MKLSILTIATAALIADSPALAQGYSDGDSGLGGTNCGSLTLQQCRATEILRAQSMLQSGRVYGAQPQLTVPSLSGVFATGNSAYAYRSGWFEPSHEAQAAIARCHLVDEPQGT